MKRQSRFDIFMFFFAQQTRFAPFEDKRVCCVDHTVHAIACTVALRCSARRRKTDGGSLNRCALAVFVLLNPQNWSEVPPTTCSSRIA